MLLDTPKCFWCEQGGTVVVDPTEYIAYLNGDHIQDAFRSASADIREQILTGTHPECWEEMFSGDEE